MKSLDHHLAPDAQVLVFLSLDVGVRIIATPRMETGAPNVFPVQVNHHHYNKVFYMNYLDTFGFSKRSISIGQLLIIVFVLFIFLYNEVVASFIKISLLVDEMFNPFLMNLGCRYNGIPNMVEHPDLELLGPITTSLSLTECTDQCETTPGCNIFRYGSMSGHCSLKNGRLLGNTKGSKSETAFYRSCDMGNNKNIDIMLYS